MYWATSARASIAPSSKVSSTPSVAEISSLIGAPLGVVRVLVGDLVHSGHLQVHATLSSDASSDERHDLIERTLRGLRDL